MKKLLFLVALIFIVPGRFCLGKEIPALSFLNTSLFIGADSSYIEYIQSRLVEKYSAAFDQIELKKAAELLRESTGINILVENSVANSSISLFFSQKPLSEILSQVAEASQTFVVYRANSLVFSKRVQIRVKFSRPISRRVLVKLAQSLFQTDSRAFVATDEVLFHLTRSGLERLRDFFLEEEISAQIIKTDAVFPDQVQL